MKKNENVTKICDICDICDMVGQVTVLGQSVGKGGALGDQKVEKIDFIKTSPNATKRYEMA